MTMTNAQSNPAQGPVATATGTTAGVGVSDRPIFIVGCARSGTTLLQLMMHSHPRIAIPPETRYLMEIYNRRREFNNLRNEDNRRRLAEWIVKQKKTKFSDLGLDGKEIVKKIVAGPPSIGSAAGIILREYAARMGKPRWGDKRPYYVEQMRQLLAMFPDAQIIHIVRDGRDCMSSLKRMPWWNHTPIVTTHRWIRAMEWGRWAKQTLSSQQYFEFRYEDLVADPEPLLRRLCAFLEEEFAPEMLEPHKTAEIAVPEKKMEWHSRTHQEINTAAVARYKKDLTPLELALIETVGKTHFEEHGYPLTPDRQRLGLIDHWKYKLRVLRFKRSQRKLDKIDERRTERYRAPVTAMLTRGQLEYCNANNISTGEPVEPDR